MKKIHPDGSYIEYYVMDGTTVGESHFTATGNKTLGIRYTLDESGTVVGFTMNGVNYYFAKNLQGDVLAVYNATTNEIAAQYTYDSWGNILSATGTLAQTNPFRYRSYYYDEETSFYYLQSRYYDPNIGRFINADSFASTGQGILGNNMFAYCNSNPICFQDSTGAMLMASELDFYSPAGFACPVVDSGSSYSGGNSGSVTRRIKEFYNNKDEQVVLESKFFSFYNGVPVIKVPGTSSFSCGIIILGNGSNEELLKHEYGHTKQLEELGPGKYLSYVVFPSVSSYWITEWGYLSGENYYSYPWEYLADQLGGASHDYQSWASDLATLYWILIGM